MGGDITVDSDVGVGTRFSFTLSLGKTRSVPHSYRSLAGKKVLAVDDNATNRIVLERYLTGLIREMNELSQPHIIAMTANALEQDRDRCLQAGMNDYIAKPVRTKGLIEVLTRASARSE
jgi:CheY-like chemotaxis protein